MLRIQQAGIAALLVACFTTPGVAQQSSTVTQADIQRLQDNVYEANTDVTQLRTRDTLRASDLQIELDELREEVIYLKVKLRKDRSLPRAEYADVRDRIENVRTRARDDFARASTPAPAPAPSTSARAPAGTTARSTTTTRGAVEIPAGTEMDVRLSNTLDSGTAQVEDRFEGTTLVDLNIEGRTVVPAGSIVRGVVTAVETGHTHEPHCAHDDQLRSAHGQRPCVSHAWNGNAGDRG